MRGGNDKFKTSAMTECSSSNMSLFFYFLAMCYLDLPSWIPILNFNFSWVEANLFIAIKMLAEFSIFITCLLKFFNIFYNGDRLYLISRFSFFFFRNSLWWLEYTLCEWISKEFWICTYFCLLLLEIEIDRDISSFFHWIQSQMSCFYTSYISWLLPTTRSLTSEKRSTNDPCNMKKNTERSGKYPNKTCVSHTKYNVLWFSYMRGHVLGRGISQRRHQ